MKVYVAGASKESERVRRAMNAVLAAGWALTLDWLSEIDKAGAANEGLSTADRRRYADADCAAIKRAHAVWLLAPRADSTGAWFELGYVQGLNDSGAMGHTRVVVSGPARMRCIFAARTRCEYDSDEEALQILHGFAGLLAEQMGVAGTSEEQRERAFAALAGADPYRRAEG